MFGLTDFEMEIYRDLTQDFVVTYLVPQIVTNAKYITPLVENKGKVEPSSEHVRQLVSDIHTIIHLTAIHMAYEYADKQNESDMEESDIINYLHNKYETYMINQFIKYGISFTKDVVSDTIGDIILELPYLYISALQDEEFDEDTFLEEKLEAYNDYLNENFTSGHNSDSETGLEIYEDEAEARYEEDDE